MSENTQNQNPKQEQYSLNDDRRVKVLSPGALVAKRFFRNRLAVVGLSILVAMFLFSFVGGLVSPYGQDEQFFTYTQMSKEFVGVTRNDTMRFVVADGQNFGSIAQSKALEAVKKGNTEFNYKDVDYTVDIQSDDFYVVYQGRDIMGYASRDLVNEADGAPKFSFDVKLAALTAMTAGEKEFAADGVDYTLDADGNILAGGEELGYVSRLYKDSICVSGTHGKTTTTSMITTALELAGRDPSAVIGGKLPLIHGYGKAGKGDDIVIEACEFSETFLKLTPYLSVVLNIDNDHLDYYGSMGELKFAFKRFALMTQFMIFANADDKNTMDVVNSIDRPVLSFGIEEEARFRAVNIGEYKPGFFEFDVLELGEHFAHIKLGVPGYHNIYNALAMCCCVRPLGLKPEDAVRAAEQFHGTGRRFEIKGECNGAVIVDDYAHHPTELAATLATAKEMGYERVIAVHQPFTYSRTKALMDDFAAVLRQADQCVLLPIMGSREVDDGSVKSEDLAAKIPGSIVVDGLESAANWVKQNAREGDLVVCMSCGDLYKACDMMVGKA